jgi:hypothetical protein
MFFRMHRRMVQMIGGLSHSQNGTGDDIFLGIFLSKADEQRSIDDTKQALHEKALHELCRPRVRTRKLWQPSILCRYSGQRL